MNNDEIKREIKHLPPQTMSAAGYINPAKKSGFICPKCGNGSGEDGTGISPNLLSNGWEYHCMRCDESFDNIKLIAEHERLNEKFEFASILKIGGQLIGQIVPEKNPPPDHSTQWNKQIPEDIKAARVNLKAFVQKCGGSWRGLTFETLDKFHCGYLKKWKVSPKSIPSERVIIPTSERHFLARSLIPEDKFGKQHAGEKEIFNFGDLDRVEPILMVEGEIDCMSICQVSNFPCIALSGSNLTKKFQEKILKLPRKKFIVMLDNDATGIDHAEKISDWLNARGHRAVHLLLSKTYNDANEFLQADADAFRQQIESVYEQGKNLLAVLPEVVSEENNDDDKPKTTRDIMHDCPADLLIPKKYRVGYDGVKAKNSEGAYFLISYTPVVITRSIQNKVTGDAEVELAFYNTGRKIWQKFITAKSSITTPHKLLDLTDQGLTFSQSTAKYVCDFLTQMFAINMTAHTLPETPSYPQPGWIEDYTKFIYPTGGDDYIFKPDGNTPFTADSFKPHGDKNLLFGLLKDTLISSQKARSIIYAIVTSPAVSFLGIRNIQLHVWGNTQSGKTATMALALALFGKPEDIMGSFNSTAVAIERLSVLLNNMPFVVNEFQAKQADKDQRKRLTAMIYAVDEARSKARGTRGGGLQPSYKFKLSMVTTGEQPITSSTTDAGAKSRMMELYCKEKILPMDLAARLHVECNLNYGFFGQDWINYLRENRAEICENFQAHFRQLSQSEKVREQDVDGSHLMSVAAIFTVGFHFCKCFNLEEFFKPEDEQEFISDLPGKKSMSDLERALEMLASYINSHPKNFMRPQKVSDYDNREVIQQAESFVCHGLIYPEKKFVAFYPANLRNVIQNDLELNPERVIRDLVAHNYIQSSGGKTSMPVRVPGVKEVRRMIKLNWDNDSGELFQCNTDVTPV